MARHIGSGLAVGLGVPALPVLGRNFAALRETEMMAVMIEPAFLTATEMEELSAEELAVRESEALFRGLREYFSVL